MPRVIAAPLRLLRLATLALALGLALFLELTNAFAHTGNSALRKAA